MVFSSVAVAQSPTLSTPRADKIYCGGTYATVKFAAIDTSAADTTVVAAVTGKKIRVIGWKLTGDAAGLGQVRWQSTTSTSLTGEMKTAYASAVIAGEISDYCYPVGCFETVAGELRNLEQGSTDDIDGYVIYIEC